MNAKEKYLMGMIWKFGNNKAGTNQLLFQSYDKLDQMEYIRKIIAPGKTIKVSTRKDPRTGNEKTLYRLNFTSEDWAENKRTYNGMNAAKIADKNFVRGFIEAKATINSSRLLTLSAEPEELEMIREILIRECNVSDSLNVSVNDGGTGRLFYSASDVFKMVSIFGKDNPKFWGEVLKKMNPDD